MKSNSDDSDYENEDYSNEDGRRINEKETYHSFFSDQSCDERRGIKRNNSELVEEASDLNDSDCNEDYYENFEDKSDMKFNSHNMYQNLSNEQDSGDECSSKNIQNKYTDEAVLSSNEEAEEPRTMKSTYHDSYHQYPKRRKTDRSDKIREEEKTDEDSSDEENTYNTKEQVSKQVPKQAPKSVTDGQNIAQRMMRNMGYKDGYGLGKHKQGRLEPVQAPKQHGRRGFGHHVPGLEASGLQWNPEEEEVKAMEDMEWISSNNYPPTLEAMQMWLKKGPKKLSIEDETQFCSPEILQNVISSKTVFDHLDDVELRNARTRCNPYETIRGAFFLNRAAVKMANIDKACNMMFTNPEGLQNNDLLYFADVCAGPGGFSEYVLWRKKWRAKGFGFTLKNENDFKLADFYAGSCETFHPYYGPKENGDVFDPSNQEAFRNLIMTHTNGKGVHFMMSDGGFSVEGQENIQEILSKQLYLCQCLVALMIVREKGHFVTKLFDLFTPFSAGIVYLMYRCFEEICIFKPNSSRPANSERYLICKSKRPGTENVARHLKHVNQLLIKDDGNNDVVELVSSDELESEKQFVEYLRVSNDILGRKQIIGLRKIAAFCENTALIETKQADMRKECLKYWELPDESRRIPRHMKPQDRLNLLLENSVSFLSSNPTKLTIDNINNTILNQPYDWFCMSCVTGPCNDMNRNAAFFMGMGRSKVYQYVKGVWKHVSDINIELPPDTLVYAEVVYEMAKESRYQQKVSALHIIDALFLGAENIGQKYLRDRHELIKKFCEALWKPDGSRYGRIRVKELIPVGPNIRDKLKVKQRIMKNNRPALVYEFTESSYESNSSGEDKPYFIPNSLIFLRSIAYPWNRCFSKTHSTTYVFNTKTRENKFDIHRPASAEASFIESFESRIIWDWPNDETLTMDTVTRLIREKCQTCNIALDY